MSGPKSRPDEFLGKSDDFPQPIRFSFRGTVISYCGLLLRSGTLFYRDIYLSGLIDKYPDRRPSSSRRTSTISKCSLKKQTERRESRFLGHRLNSKS